MKVNTDSLILGSWVDVGSAESILDVGTGSGILALMMAQKALPSARIDAIEIDDGAAMQATSNFENAKWSRQLSIFHGDICHFAPSRAYDLVVSNPPYFGEARKNTNAYGNQTKARNIARQTASLDPNALFSASSAALSDGGSMYCLYPSSIKVDVSQIAANCGLYLDRVLHIRHSARKTPYLCAFHFNKSSSISCSEKMSELNAMDSKNTLTIRNEAGDYTDEYKSLCQPFYLNF